MSRVWHRRMVSRIQPDSMTRTQEVLFWQTSICEGLNFIQLLSAVLVLESAFDDRTHHIKRQPIDIDQRPFTKKQEKKA